MTLNGREDSRVPGMVFGITAAELARVDEYEAAFRVPVFLLRPVSPGRVNLP